MVSVIVPVINQPNQLRQFVMQFLAWDGLKYELIIVDNGSGDATKSLIDAYVAGPFGAHMALVRNAQNEGFGPANNSGAKAAKYDLLLFTQPDVTCLSRETYDKLTLVEEGALYGARLIDWNSGWNFGIPYLEGWFLACKKTTWNLLGGFDPQYVPADFEDVDLSKTAVEKNIPLRTLPFGVKHEHMGGSWSQFSNREEVTRRNQKLFVDKWGLNPK